MKKEEIINHYSQLKFYDVSNEIEERNMKVYVAKLQKENKPYNHLKTIAPHAKGYKADFYYFESDNVEIKEEILIEMGFDLCKSFDCWIKQLKSKTAIELKSDLRTFYINQDRFEIKTANDLKELIRILS